MVSLPDHLVPCEQIANTSFLWLDSLSAVDPYYILPALYAAFAYGSIKVVSISVHHVFSFKFFKCFTKPFQYASLSSFSNENIKKMFNVRKYLTLTFICVITLLISKMPAVSYFIGNC